MNHQVIIAKKAGHDIPRGYLQTVLKHCPTYHGLVTQDNVDGQPLLESAAEPRSIDIDELCKTTAALKDIPAWLVFGNTTQDFNPETDMMPYIFQATGADGKDTQDILAVMLEGDFPNYTKVGEGHTEEYNLWEDFIFPTLLEKFEASQDVEDFYRRLRASAFEQAVMNTVKHRAACVFVPLTGDAIEFGRNEIGASYDWGHTSNTFGWGTQSSLTKAATAAVEAVKKPAGRLARALSTTAVASGVTPPAEPKPEVKNPPGVHNVPEKPENTDTFSKWNDLYKKESWFKTVNSKSHQFTGVPTGLSGNARNRWIRMMLGMTNEGDMPKGSNRSDYLVPVPLAWVGFAQEEVSTNDSVKKLQERILKFQKTGSDEDAQPVNEDPAQVQRPAADFLPEVSADESKASTDLVTEWATNPKAPTAKEVMSIEKKWPLFTVSRGITLANVARWSIADKKLFAKKCPNDAARLISELLLKLDEHGEFEPQVEVKPDDIEKKQVEVSPVKPHATPAKGGRLARAKGQAVA